MNADPKRRLFTWLGWLLLGGAVFCLLMVAGIAWAGGRWEFMGLSARTPRDRLVGAAVCFVLWLVVRTAGQATPRKWAALAGRLAFLTISLALSWKVGEQLTRQRLRQTQGFNSLEALRDVETGRAIRPHSSHPLARIVQLSPNRSLVYELRPGLDMDFGHRRVRTNSRGMRDSREYAEAKGADTLRILGIGDSGAFGWGVEQDEDYLSVLEQRLSTRAGPRTYEVLNLGVPGYNTWQEVEALATRGLSFQPDIVVVGWNPTDFDVPFFMQAARDFREKDVSYLWTFLFDRERFRALTQPKVIKGYQVPDELVDPLLLAGSGVEGSRRALERLLGLARKHGFKVLLFGPLDGTITKLGSELGIPLYNLYKEIPARTYPKEYAIYFMHPAPGGHRVLAEHLEQILARLGWL